MAASLGDARVHLLILHRALEEALAGLACEKAVMIAGHLVAANRAHLLDQIAEIRLVAGRDAVADRRQQRDVVLLVVGRAAVAVIACREHVLGVKVVHVIIVRLLVARRAVLVLMLLISVAVVGRGRRKGRRVVVACVVIYR